MNRTDRPRIAVVGHPGDLAEAALRECRVRDHRTDGRILCRAGELVLDHFIALINSFFCVRKCLPVRI